MFKSKHSGWTWELKRTPFGGGGGWNPISVITDPISSALGTDGGGGGILGGLASIDPGPAIGSGLAAIDPGPAIGSGLAEVDKAVNKLPGGWTLPAIITAAIVAPELAPLLAEEGVAAGVEVGVGQDAFWTAIANGATSEEAIGMGMAAQNAGAALTPEMIQFANASADPIATINSIAGMSPTEFSTITNAATQAGLEGSALTPDMIAYANASADPIGTINAIAGMTPEEFASATQLIGGPATAEGFTAGQDLAQLLKSYPDLSAAQLEDIMAINYGTDPMLSADAANLAANGYDAATIDQVLGYSYNPTELAGTGIESVAADSAAGLNAKDVLTNLSRAKQLANLLGTSGSMVKAAKMPSQKQWQQQAAQNFSIAAPVQQFGGLYEMNKNPFTFQNPMASALAGGNKQPGIYDVSGAPGTALNTTQQNKIYSSLLRS